MSPTIKRLGWFIILYCLGLAAIGLFYGFVHWIISFA